MTHDTPGDDGERLRWCATCQLNVEPVSGESGLECPSCGGDLDGTRS